MKTLEMFSALRNLLGRKTMSFSGRETQSVQGMVDISVEDQDGNVKQRCVKHNTITDAAMASMFAEFLFNNTVRNAFFYGQSGADNMTHSMISHTSPTQMGLYLLDKKTNIKPDTVVPPYVTASHNALDPSVVWWNAGAAPVTTEDSYTIVPQPQLCFFNAKDKTHTITYSKTTGVGTVQSVVWGGIHSNIGTAYVYETQTEDVNVPSIWNAGKQNQWAIEHTVDDTIVWKDTGSGTGVRNVQGHSLVNKTISNINATINVANYMNGMLRGLIAGDIGFNLSRGTVSGSNIPVTVQTYPTWKNGGAAAPAASNFVVTFTAPDGETANNVLYPVMVARPAGNKIEIFMTTFIGTSEGENAGSGCYVQKAVIDTLNPAVVAPVEVGWLPYAIGNFNTTYVHGFYHDAKYYLPYCYEYNRSTDSPIAVATSSYLPGVVFSNDFETEHNKFMARYGQSGGYELWWGLNDSGVTQLQPFSNSTDLMYYKVSRVMSGMDLDVPITKGINDVLRMTYKFRIT